MSAATQPAPAPPLRASWRAWWEFERGRNTGGGPIARIGQLASRWDVLRNLVIRQLKASYGGSFLGYAWTLFTPLSLIAVYALVFGRIARFNLQHYPLFIAAGMMPWVFFNSVVNSGLNALRANNGIIRTINMPREIFPLSMVGEAAVEYVLSLPVVFIFGLAYGVLPDRFLPVLLLSLMIELTLLVGLALLLSSIATLVQDTARIVRPILRVLFYLSPILYPVSKVHGTLLFFYKINPLVGIVELNRMVWYPHYLGLAPATVFQHAAISAGVSLAIFVIGWATFMRLEPAALKEL